ncbi:hypothetical protein ACIGW7_39875 [Streptomyces sp. NPDC053253]|uniref:hypothetical protein n=1 Tax=Streptomyces sp. NPDC053253 TaxID=3365699 RepID=UPI0037D0C3B5
MPLNVPLLLVPGEPNRHYTVHLHRVRWSWTGGSTVRQRVTAHHSPAELETGARNGLRMVSECVAAELADADVEVTENPDGSAEAVARVLCTEDMCAAVAEQYRRDADEDVEAEAARVWASARLQGQSVELLKLRGQVEKTTPGKTLPDLLAGVLAAQQERTGGDADRVVLVLDEFAHLAREGGLFPDLTADETAAQIERLIRQGRRPYPLGTAGGDGKSSVELSVPMPDTYRMVDLGGGTSLSSWTIDPDDPTLMEPERLVRVFEQLARQVAAGHAHHVVVARLVQVAGEAAARSGEEPRPTCPDRWPDDCEPDGNPAHDLLHRIGDRPEIVDAHEARAAGLATGPVMSLRTLPETLPVDDSAAVLVYREDTPGLGLLNAVLTGNDIAIQDAATGLLRWLTAQGK